MTRDRINSYVDYLKESADINTISVINAKKWMTDIYTRTMTIDEFKSYLYVNRDRISKSGWQPIMYSGKDGYTCGVCYTSNHLRNVNDTATFIGEDYIWDLSSNSLHPMKRYVDSNISTLDSIKGKRIWLENVDKFNSIEI